MAKCSIDVNVLDLAGIDFTKGKTLKFDYTQVTTTKEGQSAIAALFGNAPVTGMKNLKTYLDSLGAGKIYDKVTKLINPAAERDGAFLLNDVFKGTINADNVVELSIGLNQVLASLNTEADLVAKHKITENERKDLYYDGNVATLTTSLERLYPVIGRKVLEAKGLFIPGSYINSIGAYYAEGARVVKMLEKAGLVKVNENGRWISKGIIDSTKDNARIGKIENGPVISVTDKTLINNLVLSKKGSNTIVLLNELERLTRPYTESVPSKVPVKGSNYKNNDAKLTKETRDVIDILQKLPMKLSDEAKKVLQEIVDIVDSTPDEVTAYNTIAKKYKNSDNLLLDVFGISDTSHLEALYLDSERGKQLSKMTPLLALVQNYKDLSEKEFYLTYFMAGNSRLFQDTDTLNYQQDKHISRHIITTSEPTTYNKAETEELAARISVEYGIPTDVILGQTKANATLSRLLDNIETGEASELALLQYISKNKDTLGLGTNRVWEARKVAQALSDIRKGYASGKVTSGFMVESDATASGLLIKILTNATSPDRLEYAKRLGLQDGQGNLIGDEAKLLGDAYRLAVDEAIKDINNDNKGVITENEDKVKELIKLLDVLGYSIDGKDVRELVKTAAMTFSYGQTAENNKANFGKEIADKLMYSVAGKSYEEKNAMAQKFGLTYPKETKLDKDSARIFRNDLASIIANTSGEYLVNVLNKVYKEKIFNSSQTDIETIFKELVNLGTEVNPYSNELNYAMFMSPDAWLNRGDKSYKELADNGFRLSLDKKVEHKIELREGNSTIIKLNKDNLISANVLPIHAMDAAILIRATNRLFKELGLNNTGEDLKITEANKNLAMMLVHDAVMGNAKNIAKFEKFYEEELVNVVREYDIVDMFLQEYQYKAEKLGKWKGEFPKELAKIKEVNDSKVQFKRDNLKEGYTLRHSFATDLSKATSTKTTPDTDPTDNGPKPKKDNTTTTETVVEPKAPVETITSADKVLNQFKDTSMIIRRFLEMAAKKAEQGIDFAKVKLADEFTYTPSTDTISISVKDGDFKLQQMIEHEIIHSYITGYINSEEGKADNRVKYIGKALTKIKSALNNKDIAEAVSGMKGLGRLNYVFSQGNEADMTNELISILKSEKENADAVYELMNYINEATKNPKAFKEAKESFDIVTSGVLKTLKSYVNSLWTKAAGFFKDKVITDKELADANINLKTVAESIEAVLSEGMTYKEKAYSFDKEVNRTNAKVYGAGPRFKGTAQMKYKEAQREDSTRDPITVTITKGNEYASKLIAAGIYPVVGKGASIVFDKFDKWADSHIEIYPMVKNALLDTWESNEAILKVREYVKPDGKLYHKLNDLTSIYSKAKQNSIYRMTEVTKKLDNRISDVYSEKEIAKLDDIFAKSAIFNIASNGILEAIATGKTDIETEIKKYTKLAGENASIADSLSDVYLHRELKTYSTYTTNNEMLKESKADVEVLTTLLALSKINNSQNMIRTMYRDNKDIYNELVGLSLAVKSINDDIHTTLGDPMISRGNLIDDIPVQNYETAAVTVDDLKTQMYNESNGWKILRQPEGSNGIGIVYRLSTSQMQEGIGTNISYIKTGIPLRSHHKVPKVLRNKDNQIVSSIHGRYVVQLTKAERQQLGFHNDPVKSLVRSYAHKELIKESQVVRDELLNSLTGNYRNMSLAEINRELGDLVSSKDHPVFIKLPYDLAHSKLDKKILDKYMIPDAAMSDVGRFKDEITLIRKDVSFKIAGETEIEVFNNYKLNRIAKILQDVIRYAKIQAVIVNPSKIVMDFVSGTSLALSKGASIQEVLKYSKEAMQYSKEMSDLRNKELDLKFKVAVGDKTLEAELERVKKQIEEHPFSPAIAKGFMQSLGTEMLVKDKESITGLQANIDDLIKKLVKTDKNEATQFANTLMKVAKAGPKGFQIEAIWMGLGDRLERFKYTKKPGQIMREMGEEIQRIKTKEDAGAYISELIAAPNSSLVKLGGAFTLYADLLPRWVIYRHNKNIGMSDADAVEDTLTSMLDYKVGMPKELKFLSDLYFLPFPSFFLRIQRVILNLAEKNPVSLSVNLLGNEILGNHGQNILSSNIFSKIEKDYLITNPFDIVKGNNLTPYGNLF